MSTPDASARNPFAYFDAGGYDGKEIAPNVFIIGTVAWNNELQRWCALADVCGALALIELRVTVPGIEVRAESRLAPPHHQE
jgi:hypothetical protein